MQARANTVGGGGEYGGEQRRPRGLRPDQGTVVAAQLCLFGGESEDRVAVGEQVGRANRPRQTVVGGDREPAGLGARQGGIGGDDADGGVERWRRLVGGRTPLTERSKVGPGGTTQRRVSGPRSRRLGVDR